MDESIDFTPQSRMEEYLISCINKTGVEGLPVPQSRVDLLLYKLAETIASSGGTDDTSTSTKWHTANGGVALFSQLPEELFVGYSFENYDEESGDYEGHASDSCHLIRTGISEDIATYIGSVVCAKRYIAEDYAGLCIGQMTLKVKRNDPSYFLCSIDGYELNVGNNFVQHTSHSIPQEFLYVRAYKSEEEAKQPTLTVHFCNFNEWRALNPDSDWCEDFSIDWSGSGEEMQGWDASYGDTRTETGLSGVWISVSNGYAIKGHCFKGDGTDEYIDLSEGYTFVPILADTEIHFYISY